MLSTLQIKSAKPRAQAYKLADAGGLYLLIQPSGSKLWRYKFRIGHVEGLQALGRSRRPASPKCAQNMRSPASWWSKVFNRSMSASGGARRWQLNI